MAIITPGLVIGLLGISFVSQQKRARELDLNKEYTKRIVLNNPIVKNPFFINSEGKYLFPVSRQATFPAGMASSRQVTTGVGENDYIKAENM